MAKFDDLLRLGFRAGLARGRSGSRVWMTIGLVSAALRLVRRMTGAGTVEVHRERLKPGDTLIITHRSDRR